MTDKKRVLILTADAGFGHRSAANAIAAAMDLKHGAECECTILNPLDDKRAPFFLRDQATDYDRLVHSAPELYRLGYEASDNDFPTQVMESALTLALYEIMRDMVKDAAGKCTIKLGGVEWQLAFRYPSMVYGISMQLFRHGHAFNRNIGAHQACLWHVFMKRLDRGSNAATEVEITTIQR